MARLLDGVRPGYGTKPEGWYPVTVTALQWTYMDSADTKAENRGHGRLALTYTITLEGQHEGKKLFDACMFSPSLSGLALAKLNILAPDYEWGDFDFPSKEDAPSEVASKVKELEEVLIGADVLALNKHRDRNGAPSDNVAKIAPNDTDVEFVSE